MDGEVSLIKTIPPYSLRAHPWLGEKGAGRMGGLHSRTSSPLFSLFSRCASSNGITKSSNGITNLPHLTLIISTEIGPDQFVIWREEIIVCTLCTPDYRFHLAHPVFMMDEKIENGPILPIDDEMPVLTIEMIKNDPVLLVLDEMIEEESIPIEKSSTVEQPINALVLILLIT